MGFQRILFENPIPLGVFGLILVVVSTYVWVQTGHRLALYTALALVVLTCGGVAINLAVTTDREEIRHILDSVAADLRHNDFESVFSHIHPNAVDGLQRARRELPRYKFEEARVTGVKQIEANLDTAPPTAIAEFFARVTVTRDSVRGTAARFVRVFFMERDGQWLVRDYEHYQPTAGFQENPLIQSAF